jgi:hypothetical protein
MNIDEALTKLGDYEAFAVLLSHVLYMREDAIGELKNSEGDANKIRLAAGQIAALDTILNLCDYRAIISRHGQRD